MPTFKIESEVTVSVDLEIVAIDADAAVLQFKNSLSMSANLVDVSTTDFVITDETIEEIGFVAIEETT